jgi:3-deoxy-manno-octulosonate cytidylyltransferase (CMP-KDO synthetase)
MYKSKRVVCVVPARLHSTRFPKKVLASLGGKPLLQWVYEGAVSCGFFDDIIFAVDALETKALVESFGGKVLITSEACLNGTERLIEVKQRGDIQGDVWVNWQADEPFITKDLIKDLLQTIDEPGDLWTLRKKITEQQELEDPNVVKVVVNYKEEALYFSRYPLPYSRVEACAKYKHLGIYAFTDTALQTISTLSQCELEKTESLEQLRWLYHGMKLRVHETLHQSLGIDLPEHLVLAEKLLTQLRTCVLGAV